MIIQPSRRDLIKYGIGAAAFRRMSHAQGNQQQQLMISQKISAAAGITFVNHVAVAGGLVSSIDTTGTPIDTTGANFLIAGVAGFNGSIGTFADSKGNTWNTALTIYGSLFRIQLQYCIGATVGAGHTFGITGSANFPTITLEAFAGVKATSPQDGSEVGVGDQASPGNIQPGSITPSGTGELFVTVLIEYGVGDTTATIDSGFTPTDAASGNGAVFGYGMAYKISAGSGAENPIWTDNLGRSATMAVFLHA